MVSTQGWLLLQNNSPKSTLLTARSISSKTFPLAHRLLTDAFPLRELPSQAALEARFREPHCDAMLFYHNNQKPVGISIGWSLYDFYFIEYLAFVPEFRGKNYGSRWIESLKDLHRTVVAEIEIPESEQQVKRHKFYEKLGFQTLKDDYVMPAVRANEKPLPMWLLSTDLSLDADETARTIYREIYKHALMRPQNEALQPFLDGEA